MTDLAAVSDRMIELENVIPQADLRDDVPVYEVAAKLARIDPKTPGLAAAMVREVARARHLANGVYAQFVGGAPDHPQVVGTVAFVQGITFARAVSDLAEDDVRAELMRALNGADHKAGLEGAARAAGLIRDPRGGWHPPSYEGPRA